MRGRDDKIWRRGSAKGQAFPLSERAIEVEDDQAFHPSNGPAVSDRGKPRSEGKAPDWLDEAPRASRDGERGICRSAAAKVRRRRLARSTAPSLGPSLGQLLADRLQFAFTFGARFRIAHLQPFERVEDDLGDDQPSIYPCRRQERRTRERRLCSSRRGIPRRLSRSRPRIRAPSHCTAPLK